MTPLHPSDLEEIRALPIVYALGLDTFDLELATSVFAPDACFDASAFGLEPIKGVEAIADFLRGHQETVQSQMHLVANHVIVGVDAETATGTSYLLEEGRSIATREINRVHGLYMDRYTRIAERWSIASRAVRPLLEST
jgi:hypothetical protein